MKTQSKKDIILDTIVLPQLKACLNLQAVDDCLTSAVEKGDITNGDAYNLVKLWVLWNSDINLADYLNGTCPVIEMLHS